MGDRLLLLARRFPYNHGEVAAESYLEAEISLLSESFERVLAVATEAPSGDVPTCSLPSNVEPVALGCTPTAAHKISLTLRGALCSAFAPIEVQEAIATEPTGKAKQRAFRGYFAARAHEKYSKLMPELKRRSFEPTAIYSFWLYDTALAALWTRDAYPCACTAARAHGYDLYRDRNHVDYLPFRELLFTELDAVLPCSEDGRAHIEANWPGHSNKLHTSYLGTPDLPDLSNAPSGDTFHIVSCSRAVAVKRVTLIADALAILDAEGRRMRWTHYGDGPELAGIKERCRGFSSVAAEFPGSVPNSELLRIYSQDRIDLFVNVSESEGLPISIMEACGVGTPVLATSVGGTGEIVHDGENGRLLPANPNQNEIASAIGGFMDMSGEDALLMRHASRRIWENKFRTIENARQLVGLLKEGDIV